MGDLSVWTSFFGWCTVINFVILLFATFMIRFAQDWAMDIHSKMFNIDKAQLPGMYFKYVANFKIVSVVFSFTPWLALTLMG